ncbi:uncharacterized protein LOC112514739 [Cynara cardunculus var. scolymus]|uniref:uncharacterized protein LOC112514739 n=1 Tax=Cynara cardunculus var. scolymus TaxID=59895 RepID=UPI000D62967F|nr:uncharacterized protein LOC112514739 [Cynara cardunculus var. scolymus]
MEEDLKFLQSMGILHESFKTILKWKKIFTQITLTLFLPISIILIAIMEISKRFFDQLERDPFELFTGAQEAYRSYYNARATSIDWIYYLLFKIISITFIILFCHLFTAAVSYTVASIYTNSDVSYRKAMKVVVKVWKRLILTLLSMFLVLFAYNLIAAVFFFFWYVICFNSVTSVLVLFAIFIPYVLGFLYLSIIWQLACVVSVLENSHGLKSLIKSMDLMKGKRRVALTISFLSYTIFVGTVSMYMSLVLYGAGGLVFPWKQVIGILCVVLLLITFLLFTVTQSILYLVCKSHHREAIDKLSLSTYLGAFFGESQPVFKIGEDIQLGRTPSQV